MLVNNMKMSLSWFVSPSDKDSIAGIRQRFIGEES